MDGKLYEALRLWRLAEARGQGIPPYVIFHDSVLRDLASLKPKSLEELGQIKGVGASKLERYGRFVLGVLTSQVPSGLVARE
jgi:ATP-dependent DNA helicase RecQ